MDDAQPEGGGRPGGTKGDPIDRSTALRGTVGASLGRLGDGIALSTPEAAVLVGGPKVGDKALVGLALKELVAKGALVLAVGEEPRRPIESRHTTVFSPGGRPGPTGVATLDAVLEAIRPGRPPLDAADRAAGATRDALRTPSALAFPNGVAGTPVADAVEAVFRRYPRRGVLPVGHTHGFAQAVVLPVLRERWLVGGDHRLTPRGKLARAALVDRLGIRWRWRAGAALEVELIATASVPDLPRTFAAIAGFVDAAWDKMYGGDWD